MPVADRVIRCPHCGERRYYHARGLCRTCYNRQHALGARPCADCGKATARRGGRCGRCCGVTRRPLLRPAAADLQAPTLVTRQGIPLATALDRAAEADERSRRVEVYRRQVAATGRLDFADPELWRTAAGVTP